MIGTAASPTLLAYDNSRAPAFVGVNVDPLASLSSARGDLLLLRERSRVQWKRTLYCIFELT
jgi:hypothetical protein